MSLETILKLGVIITLALFPQLEALAPGRGFDAAFKLFCLAFGFVFG